MDEQLTHLAEREINPAMMQAGEGESGGARGSRSRRNGPEGARPR